MPTLPYGAVYVRAAGFDLEGSQDLLHHYRCVMCFHLSVLRYLRSRFFAIRHASNETGGVPIIGMIK